MITCTIILTSLQHVIVHNTSFSHVHIKALSCTHGNLWVLCMVCLIGKYAYFHSEVAGVLSQRFALMLEEALCLF